MMQTTKEAPATPDLSHLTKRQQLNIRVAETQGYEWKDGREVDGLWAFAREDGREVAHLEVYNGRTILHTDSDTFPDYAGDPAAWGALMEGELSGWERSPLARNGTYVHFAWYWEETRDGWFRRQGPWMRSVGDAICCATLKRHGIDPSPYGVQVYGATALSKIQQSEDWLKDVTATKGKP